MPVPSKAMVIKLHTNNPYLNMLVIKQALVHHEALFLIYTIGIFFPFVLLLASSTLTNSLLYSFLLASSILTDSLLLYSFLGNYVVLSDSV